MRRGHMATVMSLRAAIGKLLSWRSVVVCRAEPVTIDRHTYDRLSITTISPSLTLLVRRRLKTATFTPLGGVNTPDPTTGLQRYGHGGGVHT